MYDDHYWYVAPKDMALSLLIGAILYVALEWGLHHIIAKQCAISPQHTPRRFFSFCWLPFSSGFAFADWYKRGSRPKQRAAFLKSCNAWNIRLSLFLLIVNMVLCYARPEWCVWLFGFSVARFLSRSIEIAYAFGKDVLNGRRNQSGLSKFERIRLALISYVEIFVYSTAFYLTTPLSCNGTEISALKAVIVSLSVGSLTNIGYVVEGCVSYWQLFPFVQVFATVTLVVLSLAVYVSREENKRQL